MVRHSSGLVDGQVDPKRFNSAQHESDFRPGFALFNFNDPLPANPDLVRQGLLIKLEPPPPVADDSTYVNWCPDTHSLFDPPRCQRTTTVYQSQRTATRTKVIDRRHLKPPKTHEANERAMKHLQATFGSWRLVALPEEPLLRLAAEGEQVLAAPDVEHTVGDSGSSHHRFAKFILGEQFVFAAHGQNVGVAVLIRDV